MDLVDQKANYLSLQVFWHHNLLKEGMWSPFSHCLPTHFCISQSCQKLGLLARGTMYIKLINFPSHYLGLVITEEDFHHTLILVKVLPDSMFGNVIIGQFDIWCIWGGKGAVWSGYWATCGRSSGWAKAEVRHCLVGIEHPVEEWLVSSIPCLMVPVSYSHLASIWRHRPYENSMLIVGRLHLS